MNRSMLLLAGIVVFSVVPSPASAGHPYAPAVRELTERRTMTSRHWLLADDSYRADMFMAPVHYQASDGSWQPIDTALSPSDKPGYAFSNMKNVIKAHLPGSGNGWVRVECEDKSVSFKPVGTWDSPAAVNGNRSVYSPVAAGTTLTYEVQPGTLKELITLAVPIASPSPSPRRPSRSPSERRD